MRCIRPARPLLLSLAAAMLVAGCDPGSVTGPRRTIDPSASPILETASEFCVALDRLEGRHRTMRELRLRPGNRGALDAQYQEVAFAWGNLRRLAPDGMSDQLVAMDRAVTELRLAVMDYTTTSRFDQAADHVLRKDIAFDRALQRLRARTDCPPWAPTPRPARTPSPGPSTSPSPGTSTTAAGTG